jgi:PIN domain-containing protein
LTFLFDANLSPRIVTALRIFDDPHVSYVHASEHFPPGTADEELFRVAASRGWLFVSLDYRIKRNRAQRAALLGSGIGAFIFVGRAQRTQRRIAAQVLDNTDGMISWAEKTKRPFLFEVTDKGRFNQLTV